MNNEKNQINTNKYFPGIIVRGAGDLATGIIYRLHKSGFRVLALEVAEPTVIRRSVSFATAILNETAVVEGVTALHFRNEHIMRELLDAGIVPVGIDPNGEWIERLKPVVVIDATISKKDIGTNRKMAPVVIAAGPGYCAGKTVDAVVETQRGHYLGSVIRCGSAIEDTGIPGDIGGYTWERVIHAERQGVIRLVNDISDIVKKGDILAYIDGCPVRAKIDGVLRGMIADGTVVHKGMKIADVDPRGEKDYCFCISDKARSVAGGVMEAMMSCLAEKKIHIEQLLR